MLEEKLSEIGFTKKEARLYLELLKMGAQPVSVLAKRLKLNRTTLYSTLASLESKGIVASCFKNGVKVFVASDPNALIGYIDRQCRTYDYYKSEILSMVPEFRSIKEKYEFKKPAVHFYDGVEAVKQILNECIASSEPCFCYFAAHKRMMSSLRDGLAELRDSRILNSGLAFKCIALDSFDSRAFFTNSHFNEKFQVAYMADETLQSMLEDHVHIFANRVIMIHFDAGEEYAIVIEDDRYARMQQSGFEAIWRALLSSTKK